MPGNLFLSDNISHPEKHCPEHVPSDQSYIELCLGKGSGGTFTTLRYYFYLFSAASWKVYNILLKLVRWVFFLPPSDVYVRSFPYPFTLIKYLLYKALSDLNCIFGLGVKSSTSEATNPTPTTLSYQNHKHSCTMS